MVSLERLALETARRWYTDPMAKRRGKNGNGNGNGHDTNDVYTAVSELRTVVMELRGEVNVFRVETKTLLDALDRRLNNALFLTGEHYAKLEARVKKLEP